MPGPILCRFDALFSALINKGGAGDPHGLSYVAAKKMGRKTRKMQCLAAFIAPLCQKLGVLAELE